MADVTMDDPYDLGRFVAAQDAYRSYEDATAELRRGRKTSHWMWFVFPQIAGLGFSPASQRYAISSLDEARAYLAHPVLGPRLIECAGIVAATQDRTAEQIFGEIDADEAALLGDPVPARRARRARVRPGAQPVLRRRAGPGHRPAPRRPARLMFAG